jgi:hypothetical protein
MYLVAAVSQKLIKESNVGHFDRGPKIAEKTPEGTTINYHRCILRVVGRVAQSV